MNRRHMLLERDPRTVPKRVERDRTSRLALRREGDERVAWQRS